MHVSRFPVFMYVYIVRFMLNPMSLHVIAITAGTYRHLSHFSWLGSELLVCCLAHRGPTDVFL